MQDEADLERRIRARAHAIWEEEGRPQGRAQDHWNQARILIAIEEDRTSLMPVSPEGAQQAETQNGLAEPPAASTNEADRQGAATLGDKLRNAFKERRR